MYDNSVRIGYARVSAPDAEHQAQLDALAAAQPGRLASDRHACDHLAAHQDWPTPRRLARIRAACAFAPVTLTRQDIICALTQYSAAAISIGLPDMATAKAASRGTSRHPPSHAASSSSSLE